MKKPTIILKTTTRVIKPTATSAMGATTDCTITAPGSGPLTNIDYSTSSTADLDPSNNNGTGTNKPDKLNKMF